MNTKFAVFLHYLQMGGIDVVARTLDSAAEFTEIMLYSPGVAECGKTLYLCTPTTLPAGRQIPIILVCSDSVQADTLLKANQAAAVLISEEPVQDIYINLLHAHTKYLNWKSAMLQAISNDREPQHLVDLSEEYFTFPLAIFDEMGVLVAHTNKVAASYEPFEELLEKKHALPEVLQRITASPALSAFTIAEGSKKNTHLEQAILGSGFKNIYRNCCLREKVIFRCCFFCHTKEPSPENLAFIEEFFSLLDQCIAIHHDIFAQAVHGVPFLLMTLISEAFTDRDYIQFCLQQNRIPAEDEFVLISVTPENPSDVERILAQVREEQAMPWSLVYANSVQILLSTRSRYESSGSILKKRLAALGPVLAFANAVAVVSDPFFDIFRLADAYAQTKKAFTLAKRLRPIYSSAPFFHGKSRIISCSELYPYLLLESNSSRPEALLYKLNRYIAESPLKKEDILKTIYIHIANGCKYNVTAQILELHRNTVTNRIKQFEDALQVSFDNFEDCLNLILTIKCMEM